MWLWLGWRQRKGRRADGFKIQFEWRVGSTCWPLQHLSVRMKERGPSGMMSGMNTELPQLEMLRNYNAWPPAETAKASLPLSLHQNEVALPSYNPQTAPLSLSPLPILIRHPEGLKARAKLHPALKDHSIYSCLMSSGRVWLVREGSVTITSWVPWKADPKTEIFVQNAD